jgi:hypothetical protein
VVVSAQVFVDEEEGQREVVDSGAVAQEIEVEQEGQLVAGEVNVGAQKSPWTSCVGRAGAGRDVARWSAASR